MTGYWLYITVVALAVASPGPGVLNTLTNALRYGFVGSLAGIFGIALGIAVLAVISASSIAVLLSTSKWALLVLQMVGAAYLIYLGVQLWRSSSRFSVEQNQTVKKHRMRFLQGTTITILNPKAIFFFMALFPQFITLNADNTAQFAKLVLIYCVLVVVIHSVYAALAKVARAYLMSERGRFWVHKVTGSFYVLLGIGLVIFG